MIIPEVKITKAEMREAVEAYLATKGISLPIESVEQSYSPRTAWTVTFADPDEIQAIPPTTAPDASTKEEPL